MPLEDWTSTIYDEDVPLPIISNLMELKNKELRRVEHLKAHEGFTAAVPTGSDTWPAQALLDRMYYWRKREDLANYRYRALIGKEIYFSKKALIDLKMVGLSEIGSLNKRYEGTYLICRIITRPHRKLGVTFAVEDRIGRTEQITAYNLFNNISTGEELDALLPIGQILAIREPYRKVPVGGEGSVIRVDSPTDIVFLHHTSPILVAQKVGFSTLYNQRGPTSIDTDFKLSGNNLFKEKKYRQAIMQYSEGIIVANLSSKQNEIVLRLNRAACHLAIKNFTLAYFDTVTSLELLDSPTTDLTSPVVEDLRYKGIFRQASALEGMRFYPEAAVRFMEYLEKRPNDSLAKAGKKRIEQRLKESTTGKYDWPSISSNRSTQSHKDQEDVADFVGPIKVTQMKNMGGGRGIVATRDINCGEILLVEKVFALEIPPELPQIMSVDLESQSLDIMTTTQMISNIVDQLVRDRTLVKKLTNLHGGSRYPSLSSPELGAKSDLPVFTRKLDSIDVRRIEEVLCVNAYGITADKATMGGLGLCASSSLFNHACLNNAFSNNNFNNIMVIRARTGIKKDEQIFVSYCGVSADDLESSTEEHQDRQRYMMKYLDNAEGCECESCRMDRLEGPEERIKRDKILSDLLKPSSSINKSSLEALKDTYSPLRIEYKPKLCKPLMKYAAEYLRVTAGKNLDGYVQLVLDAIRSTGAEIIRIPTVLPNDQMDYRYKVIKTPISNIYLIVWSCLILANLHLGKDLEEAAIKWFEAAVEMEILARDEGIEFFLKEYDVYIGGEQGFKLVKEAFARFSSS